ncbi:DEKNAAC100992 [Brettanomyces naardenensis]|uniref:DEKNAAC100992 n=1 Tax=Brettanomyces naardenensis TaxID=13370 RepID=A0A448YGQ8_BRENA|nr:DEKNAAC100992 [Brettanomyces naardenensis]
MPALIDDTPETFVSDELARESDVTVSTNITPQAEYKGFASYVMSAIFLIVWLGWSLLPDKILHDVGIHYYPSRWWALAIPSYILIAMIYTYVALALYNIEVETVPLNDLRTLVDDSGVIVTQVHEGQARQAHEAVPLDYYVHHPTSGIWDLPIGKVNEVLYSAGNMESDQL